jgi:hypothetical protein
MATDIRTEPLEEPIAVKLRQECRSHIYPAASVRVFPSGCAHTAYFPKYAERFRNFEIREDDVWIVSYPKCGKRKRSYVAVVQNSTLATGVIWILRESRNFIIWVLRESRNFIIWVLRESRNFIIWVLRESRNFIISVSSRNKLSVLSPCRLLVCVNLWLLPMSHFSINFAHYKNYKSL